MLLVFNIFTLVVAITADSVSNNFHILKNQDVSSCGNDLIYEFFKQSRTMCISTCSLNSICFTAVFNYQNGLLRNCFIYNRYFNSSELIKSSTSTVYEKKETFLYLFTKGVNT